MNRLVSSRGETLTFANFPGLDVAYRSDFYGLNPYLRFETGLVPIGSSVDITQIEVGLLKQFEFMPAWSRLGIGYHKYQLAGQNPGSSRLGKVDALEAGIFSIAKDENYFLRSHVKLLVSDSFGFDTRFELGRFHRSTTDIPFTSSIFIGFTHYAARLATQVKTIEDFTEDRAFVGLSFGFSGAESP